MQERGWIGTEESGMSKDEYRGWLYVLEIMEMCERTQIITAFYIFKWFITGESKGMPSVNIGSFLSLLRIGAASTPA